MTGKTKLRFSKINSLFLLIGIVGLLLVDTPVLNSPQYALFFVVFIVISIWAFLSDALKNSESDKELRTIKEDVEKIKQDIETLKKK
jgi:hypothetical protein